MTRQLRTLSPQGWQQILKILGTGDFTRIEFHPPRSGQEEMMAEMAKNSSPDKRGTWFICEADYLDCITLPGVTSCDEITRKFAFRVDEPLPAEDI